MTSLRGAGLLALLVGMALYGEGGHQSWALLLLSLAALLGIYLLWSANAT